MLHTHVSTIAMLMLPQKVRVNLMAFDHMGLLLVKSRAACWGRALMLQQPQILIALEVCNTQGI